MFDEDFSDFCGDFADLDGDGTVDMNEYLNEEDDYNRIMGKDDDYEDDENDYSFDDDEDENFESDDEEDDNTDDDSDEYFYNTSKEEYRIAQAVYKIIFRLYPKILKSVKLLKIYAMCYIRFISVIKTQGCKYLSLL